MKNCTFMLKMMIDNIRLLARRTLYGSIWKIRPFRGLRNAKPAKMAVTAPDVSRVEHPPPA